MKNISTFNKVFLIFCALLIVFLAFTVPHEGSERHKAASSLTASD